jgi:hypothetical protein
LGLQPRYVKTFQGNDSNVRLEVVVGFELFISDDPFASYTQNRSHTWNGCLVRVIDRQMGKDAAGYECSRRFPTSERRRSESM